MADIGHQKTDDIIEELEKKIRKEYEQANKEVQQKVDKYFARFKVKDERKQAEVIAGTLSQEEYEQWRYGQMCVGERWKDLKDQLAQDYANTNNIARSIAEGYAPEVYALNHNFAAYQVQHDANMDISWTLYNREAVEYLMKDDPQLLPFLGTHSPTAEKLRERMDLLWNRQHVNSAITQGILQGESIPQISKRLQRVTDMNKAAATRNARTMMTSVENKGRQDAYDRLRDKGIDLQEMWMATLDGRTRHSHRALHGTYKDPKTGEYENGLRYPGDPMGEPEEIYNCRCCEIAEVEGTKVGAPNHSPKMGGMSFDEWLKGGSGHPMWIYPDEAETNTTSVVYSVVQGQDISSTWQRRADQFQFEIEDVMNAQGFDGVPRVVSAEEFDEYVKQANGGNGFIAQRTYSAPDQETLDAYRDQLYHGKWYVDCSTGGAQYGQGMYCAADYNGVLSDGIKEEMEHYKMLGEDRFPKSAKAAREAYIQEQINNASSELERVALKEKILGNTTEDEWDLYRTRTREQDRAFSKLANQIEEKADKIHGFDYTETITLDPSAKIITYRDLDGMRTYGNIETQIVNSMELSSEDRSILRQWIDDEDDVSNLPSNLYEIGQQIERKADEYMDMDYGSLATVFGYDAINAEGHGESGSYTVILNRTKVIFKGE